MERKPVYADRWAESTLEHAARLGEEVYKRALSRQVSWPPPKHHYCPQEMDCEEKVSLDEAFDSVMSCLHLASRQCKKYHCHRLRTPGYTDSLEHCRWRHQVPQPVRQPPSGNLFRGEETVHLTLPEGAYSVTAHNPGTNSRRTEIVRVGGKHPVTLDFCL